MIFLSYNVTFQSLANWGRDPMYPDFIPDDDSIVVTVFYQVCPSEYNILRSILHNQQTESVIALKVPIGKLGTGTQSFYNFSVNYFTGAGGSLTLNYSLTYGDALPITGGSVINVVNTRKDPVKAKLHFQCSYVKSFFQF